MLLNDAMLARRWEARLDLGYELRQGRTVLARREHFGPLRVQRDLYPEGADICHHILVHPPGGLAGGDTLSVAARLGGRSSVLLTTPGAAKWYRCPESEARQAVHFALAANATLEWLPQENIIFSGAMSDMRLRVELAEGACYLGWDVICFGRQASGERFASGMLSTQTEIFAESGLLWQERGVLAAGHGLFDSPAGLAGHKVAATMLAAGRDTPDDVLAQCRAVEPGEDALAGITRLPRVLIARWLGDSSEQARWYFQKLWTLLRPALTGREARAPRIWAT